MRKFVWIAVVAMSLAFSGQALATDGAKLFKSKCASCHGKTGAGSAMAPGLAGGDFIKDTAASVETIMKGRKGAEKKYDKFKISMPKHEGKLSEEEVAAIVAYIQGL